MEYPQQFDTNSQEWMLICLARHICRLPTKTKRQTMLDNLAAKHSPEFVSQLQALVVEQWSLVRLAIAICELPNKPARHARLAELRAAHPQEFVTQVEKQVVVEWDLMHHDYRRKVVNGNA